MNRVDGAADVDIKQNDTQTYISEMMFDSALMF